MVHPAVGGLVSGALRIMKNVQECHDVPLLGNKFGLVFVACFKRCSSFEIGLIVIPD
jgi:hypothetical protein